MTSWRVVVPLPEKFHPHETWGRGTVWGTMPLHDGRVYAYATAVVPAGQHAPDNEKAELLRRFGDWHHPVPEVLAAAEPGSVLRHDMYATAAPLPAYHQGRVALLGDAAHAMVPNLGQGGCQAIEDAIVLTHLVSAGGDLPRALATYTDQRLDRTTDVVRKSWQISRMTTWSSRPACAVRSLLIAAGSLFGPRLVLRSLDGIADWSPPGSPYAAGTRTQREAPTAQD
jgi:2-polyprenyl-6-methoxyphenol hydroxylase-like FAD-dependent oxidoreductase